MELYRLDKRFRRQDPIEEYLSVVWTERYVDSGDIVLVFEDDPKFTTVFREGTFISLADSKEVMLIDTALTEAGTHKVTGNTLSEFLKERIFRAGKGSSDAEQHYTIRSVPGRPIGPGQAMVKIVLYVAGGQKIFENGLNAGDQIISNLAAGDYDTSGPYMDFILSNGTVYDNVKSLADTYQVGFSLYLDYATLAGYQLKFKTYAGQDLTGTIKLSPAMDSLTGISKVTSVSNYKNVIYTYAPTGTQKVDDGTGTGTMVDQTVVFDPGMAYNPYNLSTPWPILDFDRRELMIEVSEATIESLGSVANVQAYLQQKATDALANNMYTKVVDGEVVPQKDFVYGVNYGLGDIIELDSGDGFVQDARITEYIRSSDASGEKSYPTVTVL